MQVDIVDRLDHGLTHPEPAAHPVQVQLGTLRARPRIKSWRILAGPALAAGPGWRLCSLCEQDGFLFLRYRPQ